MSTRGGNNAKKGQRHQNVSAFKNDLHDTSKLRKQINSLVVGGVCARCREVIEWKKKYKKYKPLTAPKKWYVVQRCIILVTTVRNQLLFIAYILLIHCFMLACHFVS